jgi:hypothetical protein
MSPTPYNAEADIAVLKEQLVALTSRVGNVAEAQAQNFGALNARFDTLTPLVQDITRLQERHEGHGRSINHAFELIRAQDLGTAELEGKLDTYSAEHSRDHAAIEKRLNTYRGWGIGASAVTATTLALVVWIASMFIDKVDATDALAHQNQLNLLQHKLDEAQKGNKP